MPTRPIKNLLDTNLINTRKPRGRTRPVIEDEEV